jgi:hypothetical protein
MTLEKALGAMPDDGAGPAEKMRRALAMYEEGVAMQRLVLRRQRPDLSEAELERHLLAWLTREDD